MWVPITDYVLSLDCERGFNYETGDVEPGVATLRLNNSDRRFDPTYSGSPYVGYLQSMKPIRIKQEGDIFSGPDSLHIWFGFVERWPIEWDGPVAGFSTITCVDYLAVLNRALISGTLPEETTGARITRMLSGANWASFAYPDTDWTLGAGKLYGDPDPGEPLTRLGGVVPEINTAFDTGLSTVAGTTILQDSNTTALSHIRDCVLAEGFGAAFFVMRDGSLRFQDRYYQFIAEGYWGLEGVNKPTFTDDLDSLGDERFAYYDMKPSYDDDRLVNEAHVEVEGGAGAVDVVDGPSLMRYGRRTTQLTPIFPTDTTADELEDYGLWQIAQVKEPQTRIDEIVLRPGRDDLPNNAWRHVLACDIGTPIVVERTFPDIAQSEDMIRNMFVSHIKHHRDSDGLWEIVFRLTPDQSNSFFTLDESALVDSQNDALVQVGSEYHLGSSLLGY